VRFGKSQPHDYTKVIGDRVSIRSASESRAELDYYNSIVLAMLKEDPNNPKKVPSVEEVFSVMPKESSLSFFEKDGKKLLPGLTVNPESGLLPQTEENIKVLKQSYFERLQLNGKSYKDKEIAELVKDILNFDTTKDIRINLKELGVDYNIIQPHLKDISPPITFYDYSGGVKVKLETDKPLAISDKVVLNEAYNSTKDNDNVKYAQLTDKCKHLKVYGERVDGKHLEQGYIDCSAWVATLLNKTMKEINRESGQELFKKADMFNVDDDDGGKDKKGNRIWADNAANILKKIEDRSEVLLTGKNVNIGNLKEGMIIAENNPGDKKRIDHIVMVVRDSNGKLMVTQSRGGEGVELKPLKDYLEEKQKKDVELYASDPLEKARPLLKDHTQDKLQGKRTAAEESGVVLVAAESSGVVREQAWGQGTNATLRQTQKSPLLSESTHPDHPLYTQAVAKLEHLGPQAFANRQQLENAAGSLVLEAKGSGMQRIDVVIQGKEGTSLFAVQGNPNDPASPRIYTDKLAATERPLEQSSNALLQDAQGQQQEQQRTQARVA
jgi:hypothetical protein